MYPDLQTILSNPDKNQLLRVRKSAFSQIPIIFVFIGLVIALYVVTLMTRNPTLTATIPVLSLVPVRFFGVLPLITLVELLRRIHNDLYIFGMHRITHHKGRISFAYSVPVIKYVDIRAINVIQSFWGRIFRYGDIAIGTAGHDGNELVVQAVSHPEALAKILDELRTNSLKVSAELVSTTTNTTLSD